MNTDSSELSEDDINERDRIGRDFDWKYGMQITETTNGNGTYANLKNAVFMAFVLGTGVIIWQQQSINAQFREEIAVLKLECRNAAQDRSYNGG